MNEKQLESMNRFIQSKEKHKFYKRKLDYSVAEKFLCKHLPRDVVKIIILHADENDSIFEIVAYPDANLYNFTNDGIEITLGYSPQFSIICIDGNGNEIKERLYDDKLEQSLCTKLYGIHYQLKRDPVYEFEYPNKKVKRKLNYSVVESQLIEEYNLCVKTVRDTSMLLIDPENPVDEKKLICNNTTKPYYHASRCMSCIKDKKKGIPNLSMYCNLNEFPIFARLTNDIRAAVHHFGKYAVAVWNSTVYIVSEKISNADEKNHKILNVLYANDYDLQHGDCKTNIYLLNNKNILLWNDGDVHSVVVIKNKM